MRDGLGSAAKKSRGEELTTSLSEKKDRNGTSRYWEKKGAGK